MGRDVTAYPGCGDSYISYSSKQVNLQCVMSNSYIGVVVWDLFQGFVTIKTLIHSSIIFTISLGGAFTFEWKGQGLWCLPPLSATFQLYPGVQIYWWRKLEYPEKTTHLLQVTEKRYHINVVSSTHSHRRDSNSQL